MLAFEVGGKPEHPEKNNLGNNDNKLNPNMMPSMGNEPKPHCWVVSALTTAPFMLLAKLQCTAPAV